MTIVPQTRSLRDEALIALGVARATARWTEDSYVIHFERCTAKEYAHCQRCEDLLADSIAAEKHAARLEKILAAPTGCQHCGEPHGVSVPCGFRRVR